MQAALCANMRPIGMLREQLFPSSSRHRLTRRKDTDTKKGKRRFLRYKPFTISWKPSEWLIHLFTLFYSSEQMYKRAHVPGENLQQKQHLSSSSRQRGAPSRKQTPKQNCAPLGSTLNLSLQNTERRSLYPPHSRMGPLCHQLRWAPERTTKKMRDRQARSSKTDKTKQQAPCEKGQNVWIRWVYHDPRQVCVVYAYRGAWLSFICAFPSTKRPRQETRPSPATKPNVPPVFSLFLWTTVTP